MAELKIEIGKKTVNPNVFKKSSKAFDAGNPIAAQYVAERRAYAIFRATGKGVCNAGTERIESENVSTSPYESILSGKRLVPPPSLTSVDWSTDAANDIIDAYLWKATVSFTCYSPEDFAKLDTSFFRHLNQVELTLGWLSSGKTNSSVKIYGNIVDYQFSINEKLHYDCSVTFAGAHIQSAAAFNTAAKSVGNTKLKFGQTEDDTAGFAIIPQSIVGILRAEAENLFGVTIPPNEANTNNTSPQTTTTSTSPQQTTSTNSQTTTTSNGEITDEGGGFAQGNASFSKATITIPDSSWITYIPFTSEVQEKEFFYVSLEKLIGTINKNISINDTFEGFFYFIPPDSVTKLKHNLCKSANPTSLINGWSAVYSDTLDLSPGAQDFFICLSELERIEEEIRRDKSDTPHLTKKSILQFFKKVCGIINENLGNAVQMEVIPYNQVGDEANGQKYGYQITDRKTVIKSSISHTVVNPLELGSLVRSISVQSTTDSEMAAIALSAAQNGGEGGSATIIKGGVFGCPDNTEDAVIARVDVSKEADAKYGAKPGETKGVGTAVAGADGKPIIAKYMVATSATENTSSPTAYTNTVAQASQTAKTNDAQKTPEAELTEMFAAYSVFDSAVVSDTLVVMKKIWGSNPGQINGYSYGVTVTVTVDGYAENLFGQTFRVAGLPSMLTRNNVYFVVLKQGHKFSNGDWTMDLEGQMMFDFNGKTAPNPPIAEGITPSYAAGASNINEFDLTGDWIEIAMNVIQKEEGGIHTGPGGLYNGVPQWDENHLRAGFGTDRKLVNGLTIEVNENTRFTLQEALDTLKYQIIKDFAPPIKRDLGEQNWNKLSDSQKAALVILGYNTGPGILGKKYRNGNSWANQIYNGILSNNYPAAAQGIRNGPITGAESGKVYDALVRRRNLEADIFLSGINSTQHAGSNTTSYPPNIVIGDSQTPYVDWGSKKFKLISSVESESALWTAGKNLAWLNGAVSNNRGSTEVKNIAICIGTNGNFSESEATIEVLIDNIKKKFPTAKLFAIKGSWGWSQYNKNVTENDVNKYYAKFAKFGVTVIPTPIGPIEPHGNKKVYLRIGSQLDAAVR